jgi:hypothetical protein
MDAGRDGAATLAAFGEKLDAPEATQAETAQRLVAQLAQGRFGREHGLDRVGPRAEDAVAALRERVPLRDFEGHRAFIEPAPEDLSGERPLCLLRTSASTGRPKLIPYTRAFRDSIKRAHDVFTFGLYRDLPSLPIEPGATPRGLGLYQLSTASETALGLPVDSYVSRLYDVARPDDPFFFALDRRLCQIADARERLFAMALAAARWDLRALRATNPTTLLLFSRVLGEETDRLCRALRDGVDAVSGRTVAADAALARRLSTLGRGIAARDLWPQLALLVTWRGGTCQLFEPHLKRAFGDEVRIRAPIFAASEGVVAIPLADADLGGAPAIESSFFEFLPEAGSGTDTLLLHELEEGRRYELVLSAPTGMTRYRIGDLIEVDGRVGRTPSFHFLARKGRTSSLTGEKLTELQVEESVSQVAERLAARPVHFLLSAHFDALPYYVLSLDFGAQVPQPAVLADFERLVDEALGERNIEYRAKRESARLGPVRLQRVRPGEFERLQAGGLSGGGAINYKLAHLSSEPIHRHLVEA